MTDKLCGLPGCGKTGVHLCAGCGGQNYCSKEHQREDWANHKMACKMSTKPEAATLLGSFDGLSLTQLKNIVRAKAASFSENKRRVVLQRMDKALEKDELLKIVGEHVHPSEIETLLSGPSNASATASSSAEKIMRNADKKTRDAVREAVNSQKLPSPDQLLRQVQEMRRNPDRVRSANPIFAKMSNAEIFSYADQMEQAAKDPAKFQAMMEMSKMPESDRNEMMLIQDGLTGTRTRDDAWFASVVSIIKKNPALIKSMYSNSIDKKKAGVDGEQIDTFVDFICGLPEWALIRGGKTINWAVGVWPTVSAAYTRVDDLLLGCAKYIVMVICFIFLYYLARVAIWAIMLVVGAGMHSYRLLVGGASTSASTGGAAVKVPVADEPDF